MDFGFDDYPDRPSVRLSIPVETMNCTAKSVAALNFRVVRSTTDLKQFWDGSTRYQYYARDKTW